MCVHCHKHTHLYESNYYLMLKCLYAVQCCAVEPVLKDHLIGHKNVVFQDSLCLMRGSI